MKYMQAKTAAALPHS